MLRKHKYLCTPCINYIQIGTLHEDKIEDLSIKWRKTQRYQNIQARSPVKASSTQHKEAPALLTSGWVYFEASSRQRQEMFAHTHIQTHTERGCLFHPCAAQNTCHGSLRRKLPPLQKNVRFVRQSRQILAFFIARVNRCRVDAKSRQKRTPKGLMWDCHRIPSSLSHILIKYFVYVLVIGCLRVAVEMRNYVIFFFNHQVTAAALFLYIWISND